MTEIPERPGQASVQNAHVKGEASGCLSDRLASLDDLAKQLGLKVSGMVVGISIRGGNEYPDNPDCVDVSLRVLDTRESVDTINEKLGATNGVLSVKEYRKENVSVVDFVNGFKRLQVSLFEEHIKADGVSVADDISLDDPED